MKLKTFLIAMFLVVAPTAVSLAAADDGRDREQRARRMWTELNLTAEQEVRFREINARHAPARRDHSRRIEELRERINQELLKDRPSRGLLAQLAGQMGETQKKMNIASVNHFLDVKAVLTPEQFKQFTEMASVGGGSGGRRRGGAVDRQSDIGDPDEE
jgi:Spy/CpxP family protein refolding chaperone